MKISSSTLFSSKAPALLIAIGSLVSTAGLNAQTTFLENGNAGLSVNNYGSPAAVAPALYNVTGPNVNNIIGVTFGNNFAITDTTANVSADNSFVFGGKINGSALNNNTPLSVSYNFTVTNNGFITTPVNWYLKLTDAVNNPGMSQATSTLIASGTLSGGFTSANLAGSGNPYSFVTGMGANSNTDFRVFFEFTYTTTSNMAISPGVISGMMSNTGFGGEGITLGASAIPEPSTYAAFAGLGVLGFAAWRRRKSVCAKLAA